MIDFPVLSYDTAYPGICDPMPRWEVGRSPCSHARPWYQPKNANGILIDDTTHKANQTRQRKRAATTHKDTLATIRRLLLLTAPTISSPQVTWNPPDCNMPVDGSAGEVDVRGMMPPAAWAHSPHGAPLVESAAAPPVVRESPPPVESTTGPPDPDFSKRSKPMIVK
jgi:hypothetical protein